MSQLLNWISIAHHAVGGFTAFRWPIPARTMIALGYRTRARLISQAITPRRRS